MFPFVLFQGQEFDAEGGVQAGVLRGATLRGSRWGTQHGHVDSSLSSHGPARIDLRSAAAPRPQENPGLGSEPALRTAGRPAVLRYPQPVLRAAALGSANETLAFPAGAGQSAASICWKRETLRGKAITKAFHCRQMLSVCADFSCF